MEPNVPLPLSEHGHFQADKPTVSTESAVRIQTAAVAAQQVALTQEETTLAQRRSALQEHEEQLARHLEEKRQELVGLGERLGAERAALDKDRATNEARIEQTAHQLEERTAQVREGEQALAQKQLRFHTEYELGRRQLQEAWERLRVAQQQWRHRRGQERAVLNVRRRDCETAEGLLLEARRRLEKEKWAWENTQATVQMELAGAESRLSNQRAKIEEQKAEIARLDAEIGARLQEHAMLDGAGAPSDADVLLVPGEAPQVLTSADSAAPSMRRHGCADLDLLAGDLSDQRMQLVEQWHRLAGLQAQWENERLRASRELEQLSHRLADQVALLTRREQTSEQAGQVLSLRHEELVRMRRQLIAWRARLSVREAAWEGERRRLLAELQGREKIMDRHFGSLVELRRRWVQLRRAELDKLRAEHTALAALRVEKQYLAQADGAADAEKRITALLTLLESRFAQLEQEANGLAQEEVERIQKQTAWEHQQTLAVTRHARLQQEMQAMRSQRKLFERQIAHMKDEIERIARALIDEPDPPITEALTTAA